MKSISESDTLPMPMATSSPKLSLLSRRLLIAAWVFWLVSLALPSFAVATRVGTMPGLLTLIFGALFGWTVFGWAAYANLFFLYAATRLSNGRDSPKAVLAMLLLALTVFGFNGVIRDEGSGTVLPVVSWGWGSLLWGYSIALLTLASLVDGVGLKRQGVFIALAILFGSALGLGGLGFVQRERANLQERETYFPWGVAFTTVTLSNLSFSWPDSAIVPKNELVALEIDDALDAQLANSPYHYLPLPTPKVLRQSAADWIVYDYGEKYEIKVRTDSSKIKYLLQAKKVEGGALIKILDLQNNQTLYEQPLRTSIVNSAGSNFLPEGQPWTYGVYGVRQSIDRALGIEKFQRPPAIAIEDSNAVEPCSPKEKQSQIQNLFDWDGREVLLKDAVVQLPVGFCSKNYIAVAEVRSFEQLSVVDSQVTSSSRWRANVRIFDRASLAPVAVFYDAKPWNCERRCPVMNVEKIRGVRFTNNEAVVATDEGDISVEKRRR